MRAAMLFTLRCLAAAAAVTAQTAPQPAMREARSRVLKTTKDAKIFFLNVCNDKHVVEMIKEGVMICTGGYEAGRRFTNSPAR
jgi:hypothetical protein